MTTIDGQTRAFIDVVKAMRAQGVSIRDMAKFFGESKSTMARTLKQIDQLEQLEAASQVGTQRHGISAVNSMDGEDGGVPNDADRH